MLDEISFSDLEGLHAGSCNIEHSFDDPKQMHDRSFHAQLQDVGRYHILEQQILMKALLTHFSNMQRSYHHRSLRHVAEFVVVTDRTEAASSHR